MRWGRANGDYKKVKGLEVRKERSRFRRHKNLGKYKVVSSVKVVLWLKTFEGE